MGIAFQRLDGLSAWGESITKKRQHPRHHYPAPQTINKESLLFVWLIWTAPAVIVELPHEND